MNDTTDYLVERIKILEEQRLALMNELRRTQSGVFTPLVSEQNGESIYLVHECPKCHLKTVQKRMADERQDYLPARR